MSVSVIVPALNEEATVGALCRALQALDVPLELIVVDDGSGDATARVARETGARVLVHPERRGNGAAIKTGLAAARGSHAVILDADGQHDPAALPLLLKGLAEGADLVVASRPDFRGSGPLRGLGNRLLCALASRVSGASIPDLTSGFRAFRLDLMRGFVPLLPEGFSTPTTSTLAFLHAGYEVRFEFVPAAPRPPGSRSHTRVLRDGARFLTILLRVTTLFEPRRAARPLVAALVLPGAAGLAMAPASGLAAALGVALLLAAAGVHWASLRLDGPAARRRARAAS